MDCMILVQALIAFVVFGTRCSASDLACRNCRCADALACLDDGMKA